MIFSCVYNVTLLFLKWNDLLGLHLKIGFIFRHPHIFNILFNFETIVWPTLFVQYTVLYVQQTLCLFCVLLRSRQFVWEFKGKIRGSGPPCCDQFEWCTDNLTVALNKDCPHPFLKDGKSYKRVREKPLILDFLYLKVSIWRTWCTTHWNWATQIYWFKKV